MPGIQVVIVGSDAEDSSIMQSAWETAQFELIQEIANDPLANILPPSPNPVEMDTITFLTNAPATPQPVETVIVIGYIKSFVSSGGGGSGGGGGANLGEENASISIEGREESVGRSLVNSLSPAQRAKIIAELKKLGFTEAQINTIIDQSNARTIWYLVRVGNIYSITGSNPSQVQMTLSQYQLITKAFLSIGTPEANQARLTMISQRHAGRIIITMK